MGFERYLDRIKRIDKLIYRKATGTSEEFAERVGLCRSALLQYLSELKELGAPVKYCKISQTYYYVENKRFYVGYIDYNLLKKETP